MPQTTGTGVVPTECVNSFMTKVDSSRDYASLYICGNMPAKLVGCLYLFGTTLFHGKCDFN